MNWRFQLSYRARWNFVCAISLFILAGSAWAGHKAEIGLSALQAELGAGSPTGAGITVSQVEAPEGSNYAPDPANPEFSGKTFLLKSGASGPNGHATVVGQYLYGNSLGIAPGITSIDAYEGGHYLGAGFLNTGSLTAAPLVETRRIQTHSWVGDHALNQEIIRRLDFAIQRDGFLAVVAVNNGSGTTVPGMLAHSYNALCVGQSNGDHSRGGTTFDTAGRVKPDIVATSESWGVSFSVPVVSGSAALLLQTADALGAHAARTNSEVIKAMLMAGATKHEFPSWNRTSTRPLDSIYGAGEVNVYRSYKILVAGKQSASNSATVARRGWNFAATAASPSRYFFDVPTGSVLTNFSALVAWNRNVYDSVPGPTVDFQTNMANIDLRLYSASSFTPGTLLDSSISAVDNVEHIFTNRLVAGRYLLEVSSDVSGYDYAIAWTGELVGQTAPALTITRSSSTITVAWPSWAADYVLQSAASLTSPITWTTVPPPYTTSGTNFTYSTAASGQQRYFRLQLPE